MKKCLPYCIKSTCFMITNARRNSHHCFMPAFTEQSTNAAVLNDYVSYDRAGLNVTTLRCPSLHLHAPCLLAAVFHKTVNGQK